MNQDDLNHILYGTPYLKPTPEEIAERKNWVYGKRLTDVDYDYHGCTICGVEPSSWTGKKRHTQWHRNQETQIFKTAYEFSSRDGMIYGGGR